MNLLQLVLKQMRQRALGTWLTMLSVLLGMALACSILILQREGQSMFAQTDYGYDVLIGPPKGSPLQLTLNTVYHLDVSPGVVPYVVYEDLSRKGPPGPGRADFRPFVKQAVPFMVGDSFEGRRIVGTSPRMFGFDDAGQRVTGEAFMYRAGKKYELAAGRAFGAKKFEAVIGSEIAAALHLRLYDDKLTEEQNEAQGGAFRATHGMPGPNETPDIHKPRWHIVGILQPTHTANDRVLFVPFISLYAIAEHEGGMIDQALLRARINPATVKPEQLDGVLASLGIDPGKVPASVKNKFKLVATQPTAGDAHEAHDEQAYDLDAQGDIVPHLPKEEWSLSAVMIQARGPFQAEQLLYNFKLIDDRAAAVNPASVMRDFFSTFLSGTTTVLLVISLLVTVVAGVGILVSIYNSVSARMKEIAILRALGATRKRVLTLICIEAGLIGLVGGLAGLMVGHAMAAVASVYMNRLMGQTINWSLIDTREWKYLAGVVILAVLAGLVPALKAYRTSVAANLVAS